MRSRHGFWSFEVLSPTPRAVTVPTSLRVPKAVRKTILKNTSAANLESEPDTWQMAEVLRGSLDGAKSREARVTAPPFRHRVNQRTTSVDR